jgi:hypothetical protein
MRSRRFFPYSLPVIYSGFPMSKLQGVQGASPLRGGSTPTPRISSQRKSL